MKNFARPFSFVWILGMLLAAGCLETKTKILNDSIPGPPYVVLVPTEKSPDPAVITSDRIVVGIVGKPIARAQFVTTLPVLGPAEVRCQISFHRLRVPQTDFSSDETLNFDIKPANDPDWNCSETPGAGHKDVICHVERAGLAQIRLESANPNMAVGFGFLCSQKPRLAQLTQTTVKKPARNPSQTMASSKEPQDGAHGTVAATKTNEPPLPIVDSIEKSVSAAVEGSDDKHKVLTLSPCKEPLPVSKGKAFFDKLRRSFTFTVVNSKRCEIEVADVPESVLDAADPPVKLTR